MRSSNSETANDKAMNPGDRVALCSGGPSMTVIDIGVHSGFIWCRWMSGSDVREGLFPPATLVVDPRSAFTEAL
jgi:uncharacterized protein YodC (DUF2158 family)